MDRGRPQRPSKHWLSEPAIGRLVTLLREEAGWSQRQLAEVAGMAPSTINRVEAGSRRPSMDALAALADAFGLPPSYLAELSRRLTHDGAGAEDAVREVVRSFTVSSSPEVRFRSAPAASDPAPVYESSGLPPAERPEIAATIPAGELRWVFRRSVGRDDRGYWLDSAARANRGGLDVEDVRLHRHDDGTFVIDITRLEHDIGPRDPDRHVALVDVKGAEQGILADAYAATVLELTLPDGSVVVVEPTDDGSVQGPFPESAERIHVITAHNPRSVLLSPSENTERNRELERRLRGMGARFRPGTGRSPEGSWTEPGFAVFDEEEAKLLDMAEEFDQNAIFRWTPLDRSVVYTDTTPEAAVGWRSTPRKDGPV